MVYSFILQHSQNPIVDRHRRYVREGRLDIFMGFDKRPDEHYFFLFNDLMIYTKKVRKSVSSYTSILLTVLS